MDSSSLHSIIKKRKFEKENCNYEKILTSIKYEVWSNQTCGYLVYSDL